MVAALLAGLEPAADNDPAHRFFYRLWRTMSGQRPLFLAGWPADRGYWWGERALALANSCDAGAWGALPAAMAGATLLNALPCTGEECSICTDEYSDPLPAPVDTSRAPAGMFHCSHALCIACDRDLESRAANNAGLARCPLCRADRRVWGAHGP